MDIIINNFVNDQLGNQPNYEGLEELVGDVIAECGADIDDVPTSLLAKLIDASDPGSSLFDALMTEYANRQG